MNTGITTGPKRNVLGLELKRMSPFEKAKERLADRDREKASLKILLEGSTTLPEAVNAYERKIIFEALRLSNGEICKAAQMLGITYQGLSYILDTRHQDLRHKPKVKRKVWFLG